MNVANEPAMNGKDRTSKNQAEKEFEALCKIGKMHEVVNLCGQKHVGSGNSELYSQCILFF